MKREFPYQNYWILFIAVWAGFAVRELSQYYNNHKAHQTVRNAMPVIPTNLNNLSQEEQNRIYKLRQKAFQIIYNNLDDQDKVEMTNLINGGLKTNEEFDRWNILLDKVKPKLTVEEKEILADFYESIKKLSDIKINAKLF